MAAGELFRRALDTSRATVIPVDSEHNAAFQVLDFGEAHAIDKVTLTASGGPFREWTRAAMEKVTPEQAVAHPNWSMGAKISVDSATLMNKGLELIEAHFLFALPAEKLDVDRASAIGGALPRHLCGRLDAGASFGARHAHAHRPCAGLAPAHRCRRPTGSIWPRSAS